MSSKTSNANRPILVVEDSFEDFETILEAARRSGIKNKIIHAPDAFSALRHLPPGGSDEPFAFVLLDQNLPGISGCELLQDLRVDHAYRSLPVIVYTTSTDPRDRDACYRAGANGYHAKSVRFDECLRTLDEVFQYWLGSAILPAPPPRRHGKPFGRVSDRSASDHR